MLSLPQAGGASTSNVSLNLLPAGRSLPVNGTNYFTLKYTSMGQARSTEFTGIQLSLVVDTGTNLSISAETTQSTPREMWLLEYDSGSRESQCGLSGVCVLPYNPHSVSFDVGSGGIFTYFYYDVINSTVSMQFQGAPFGEWGLWPGATSTTIHDVGFAGVTAPPYVLGPSSSNCGFAFGDTYPHTTPTVFYFTRGTMAYFPSWVYYNSTYVWAEREGQGWSVPFSPVVAHYDLVRGSYTAPFTINAEPQAVGVEPGGIFTINATVTGEGILWNATLPAGVSVYPPRGIYWNVKCNYEVVRSGTVSFRVDLSMKQGTYDLILDARDADQTASTRVYVVVVAPTFQTVTSVSTATVQQTETLTVTQISATSRTINRTFLHTITTTSVEGGLNSEAQNYIVAAVAATALVVGAGAYGLSRSGRARIREAS